MLLGVEGMCQHGEINGWLIKSMGQNSGLRRERMRREHARGLTQSRTFNKAVLHPTGIEATIMANAVSRLILMS
jgi:hypothetical protein